MRRTAALLLPACIAGALGLVLLLAPPASAAPEPPITVGDSPTGVTFAGSGQRAYVANRGSDTVSVIDVASGTVVGTIASGAQPFAIAGTPDGTRGYVASEGRDPVGPQIDRYDLTTGTPILPPFTGSLGNPSSLVATDTWVYVTNVNAPFVRYQVGVGTLETRELGTSTRGVALDPATGLAYVTEIGLGQVAVIDTATFAGSAPPDAVIPLGAGTEPWGIALNPVRHELYAVNSGSANTLSIIDIDPSHTTTYRTVIGTAPIGSGGRAVAVSPDGDRVYVASLNGPLTVVNRATGVVGTAPVGAASEGVAASPDGQWVYVTNGGDDTVTPFHKPTVSAPADTSVVEGAAATFTVGTTGDATAITWETSRDGTTWTAVPGATGPTLTLQPVLADSGLQVRAVVQSVVFAWQDSAAATLTVTAVPPTPSPTPTPTPTPAPTGEVLPATGSSSGPVAGLATGLVLVGGAGVALARRRRA